jgi:preprotein translocase subunit SecA
MGKEEMEARKANELNLERIKSRWAELHILSDAELQSVGAYLRGQAHRGASTPALLVETFAVFCEVSERVLGLRPFDVQILGGLALCRGKIVEMQTGEGKTLAAVPAVTLNALAGSGVHVLTVNDYLARRDAKWMGDLYRFFGLTVGHLSQGMSIPERQRAYASDVLYATANEVGFDYLRDNLCLHREDLVQRAFHSAVIDEADSILIDEARIPLVIAGGRGANSALALLADRIVRGFRRYIDFSIDEYGRNVQLTDTGVSRAEIALGCSNLFETENLPLLTAVQDALHAHVFLHRDVDYVVRNNTIELVDEFKGRIAQDRRWPAGLQTALEAKECVPLRSQGIILGSITLQNLISIYPKVCGMTGTAATQAEEFQDVYRLGVEVIPTNKPMIRVDHPDVLFRHKSEKEAALIDEITSVHATGRPVLVGTASVHESEHLSRALAARGVPHETLNARNDEREAEIIARAGALGAVTISTNMAGRGTDIRLGGDRVVELGGLYVIGTNKHESRRIDNQLRGRSGRQGDPGSSRFFISLQDDLMIKYGIGEMPSTLDSINSVQRIVEGQNLEIRKTLWKYETVLERQRKVVHQRRREVLLDEAPSVLEDLDPDLYDTILSAVGPQQLRDAERQIELSKIDELWSDYLATVTELRTGIHWVSWGGRDPLHSFLTAILDLFADFEQRIDDEIVEVFRGLDVSGGKIQLSNTGLFERGATWTYLITDQPFGTWTERILKGIARKFRTGRE